MTCVPVSVTCQSGSHPAITGIANYPQMDERPTKRRGPLLWLAERVRHRPFAAIVLGLLLVLIAVVSGNWAFVHWRLQRARESQIQAQQAHDRLYNLGRQMHERALEQKPQDDSEAP